MRVGVFGGTGMLGRAIIEAGGEQFVAIPRHKCDIVYIEQVERAVRGFDVIINAAGITNERAADEGLEPPRMAAVNTLGAANVESACLFANKPLIHVSTDCAIHPVDRYGRTKLAGEPLSWGLTVRTSFAGPDAGFWKWLAAHPPEATLPGYGEAWWSGSTVWAVAERLVAAALDPDELAVQNGVRVNLATATPITKYDALMALALAYGRGYEIALDRSRQPDRIMRPTMGWKLPQFADALHHPKAQEAIHGVPNHR